MKRKLGRWRSSTAHTFGAAAEKSRVAKAFENSIEKQSNKNFSRLHR